MSNKLFFISLILFSSFATQANISEINKCRSIDSDEKRLACYDSLAANITLTKKKLKSATVSSKPVVTEQFGLKEKRINEPDEIIATVTKVKKNPFGQLTISLDNQQVWKQTESTRFRAKVGDKVAVKKAALGSFMMKKVGSNKTIRVKRLK